METRLLNETRREKRPRDRCTFCHKIGHTEERCWTKDPSLHPVQSSHPELHLNKSQKGATPVTVAASTVPLGPVISSVEVQLKEDPADDLPDNDNQAPKEEKGTFQERNA